MKRTYALAALGCMLSGVDSKILRWAPDRREASWRPAQATIGVAQLLGGTSPKPTNAPGQPHRALNKRSTTDNTCAYVSGVSTASLSCYSTDACYVNTIRSVVGCCPDTVTGCPIITTCYDSTQSKSFSITDNGLTMYCDDSDYPVCIQHLYKDPIWTGYTLWGCAKSQRTDFVYYTPTSVKAATSTSTDDDDDTTSSSSTKSRPTASSTDDDTTTATQTGTNSPTPSPSPGGSSAPIGAIVGGVVGGVAALGLIGLGLFFLLRKKPSGAAPPAGAAAAASAPGQGPAPGGPYDPSQPQMAQQQGQYGYPPAGFAPVDPRASIAKPPFATVQQTAYDPAFSPPGSPPPGSPAPAYNAPPSASPPLDAYGQPVSANTTGYGQPGQQPYQATQYNPHATHFAAELPTQKGDGEVRELA